MTSADTKPASLAATQQYFADALLDANATASAFSLFASDDDKIADRLSLYRGNLAAIWQQALSNAYPVLLQLVGDDYFSVMARAYGRAHPSQEGDLNLFGEHLAQFLVESGVTEDYPYFADVAALEWQLHRAYYAKDAHPISLIDLINAAQERDADMQNARLHFCPAVSVITCHSPALAIWLAHQSDDSEWPENLQQTTYIAITRLDWQPQAFSISNAEYLALQALMQGEALAQALEIGLQCDSQLDVAHHLQTWFSKGLFAAANFSPSM